MLCQFTVKNFKCIKNELTLDMQATNITENEHTLLTDFDEEKFLPLAVIYGPNASGKSTVLEALYSLICKIMKPICAALCDNIECFRKSHKIAITPFKFSKEMINSPTEYEVFFRTLKREYHYQLSILKNKVIEERLYKKELKGCRFTLVFERNGKNIILKNSLKRYSADSVSDELTLISYLGITHRRNAIIKDIINWFEKEVLYINYSSPLEDAKIRVTNKQKQLLINMLSEMDIDISDYRITKEQNELQVYFMHCVNGDNYELKIEEESHGTKKIFGMLPPIIDALQSGITLLIDELDAKLHPLLIQYIIGLFNNPNINKHNAQLIFTSHDLTTMNSRNFRRDEIWFVARDNDLSSKMYSLVEFKNNDGKSERKDANYAKRYLEGRYGADPYLRKIIKWGENN